MSNKEELSYFFHNNNPLISYFTLYTRNPSLFFSRVSCSLLFGVVREKIEFNIYFTIMVSFEIAYIIYRSVFMSFCNCIILQVICY